MRFTPALLFRSLLPVMAVGLLMATGCSSDKGGRPGGRRPKPLPPMAGQETFFNGDVVAEVLIGALTGFDREPPPRGDGEGGRHRGGGGGMRMRMGGGMGMGGGVGGTGGRMGGLDGSREGGAAEPGQVQAMATRRADATSAPPVMIHLRFTNHGKAPVALLVTDFLSPLGNFVVTPEKIALDPDQSLEVDPMTSRLSGEVTAAEVTLSLRRNGTAETKTITLALRPESPAATDAPTN